MLPRVTTLILISLAFLAGSARAAMIDSSMASVSGWQPPVTDRASWERQTIEAALLGPAVRERLLPVPRFQMQRRAGTPPVRVPEPGILTLMAVGVLALALMRRLRSPPAPSLSKISAAQAAGIHREAAPGTESGGERPEHGGTADHEPSRMEAALQRKPPVRLLRKGLGLRRSA